MGCVYSNHGGQCSKRKGNGVNGDLANGNGPQSGEPVRWNNGANGTATTTSDPSNDNNNNNSQSARRSGTRSWDVEVDNIDKDGNTVTVQGKMEITDNSIIYRLKGRSPIIWPLRFLRSYGHDKELFSFECGRRCPTGEGVYVFKCSNADQLFKTLLEVINNATHLNSSNMAINNPIPGSSSVHEYQNLSPFDHSNFGTLPSRIPAAEHMIIPRPHSSMSSSEQANTDHTYLNFNGQNVIGPKSQPNYYTSNPLSCQSCQFEGSKTSLNGTENPSASNAYDSSTLPHARSSKSSHHEYVNSNICFNASLDDSLMKRRKSSEQHLYENHEIPLATTSRVRKLEQISSKMTVSDDLSTFCYINLDVDARRDRQTLTKRNKNVSARTTPEPKQSYIQLDLNSNEAKSHSKLPAETSKKEPESEPAKEAAVPNGEASNGTVKSSNVATVSSLENNAQDSNSEANGQDVKPSTTVPYAQIDFAKTLALSTSAANHRKL